MELEGVNNFFLNNVLEDELGRFEYNNNLSYLQPCQSLLGFYSFLIISRWRLNSYNAHSKVLGDVSIDAPSIFCK
jgi:hypothetical protein